MTLGDWITWLTFAAGAYALGTLAWRRWGALIVSIFFVPRPPEITSSQDVIDLPIASPPMADARTDGRTPQIAPELKPATLDTVRRLRAHRFTRDEARDFLRELGWSLGNNTWAQAAPLEANDDDSHITPYGGRRTRASYYPEDPALEYKEPPEVRA